MKIRYHKKTKLWRQSVFKNDNYTCQDCGAKNGNGHTVHLEAHHIKMFYVIIKENNIKTIKDAINCEELWNINNGQTLCKKCHEKTKIFVENQYAKL